MNSIHFDSVSFKSILNGRLLLNDITTTFPGGSLSVVTGHSGSGKSMLLRCINGLVPRRFQGKLNGSILLDSRSVHLFSESELWKIVASVFQEPERQFVALSPRNEISFSLLNAGMCCIEVDKRIAEIAASLNLTHLLDQDINTLSGGEMQKVAIASILISDPDIILLDEPIASLDNKSSRSIVAMLLMLKERKKTIVCAEHRIRPFLDAGIEYFFQLSNGKLLDNTTTSYLRVIEATTTPMSLPYPNTRQKPLISLKSVSYTIDSKHILTNIDMSIYPGDIIALIGHNGAGKTTLLKSFIGLIRPSSGSILLEELETTSMTVAELSRFVGYICQSPSSMIFSESVRDEIRFGLSHRSEASNIVAERVQKAANLFSLEEYMDTHPMLLSVGQRKLVCAAAISSLEPRSIFVLDEPTASLDKLSSERILTTLIESLDNRGMIFSTHNITEARRFSNRCIILDQGRIVEDLNTSYDLSDEVLRKYDLL